MARLKMETKKPGRPTQEGGYKNPNQFRRPNNVPQIMQRERRNQEDQRVFPPFKIMQWKNLKKFNILRRIQKFIYMIQNYLPLM
jgi:hypothetical protein